MSREIEFRAWDKEDKRFVPVKERNWSKHPNGKCDYIESEFFMDGDAMDCRFGITSFVTLDGYFVDVYPFDGVDGLRTSITHYPDRFELMQYTGLKDKNGVKIFEGDVVKINGMNIAKLDGIGNVYWSFEGAYWACKTKLPFLLHQAIWNAQVEIIGNLYENPDLLEQAK